MAIEGNAHGRPPVEGRGSGPETFRDNHATDPLTFLCLSQVVRRIQIWRLFWRSTVLKRKAGPSLWAAIESSPQLSTRDSSLQGQSPGEEKHLCQLQDQRATQVAQQKQGSLQVPWGTGFLQERHTAQAFRRCVMLCTAKALLRGMRRMPSPPLPERGSAHLC